MWLPNALVSSKTRRWRTCSDLTPPSRFSSPIYLPSQLRETLISQNCLSTGFPGMNLSVQTLVTLAGTLTITLDTGTFGHTEEVLQYTADAQQDNWLLEALCRIFLFHLICTLSPLCIACSPKKKRFDCLVVTPQRLSYLSVPSIWKYNFHCQLSLAHLPSAQKLPQNKKIITFSSIPPSLNTHASALNEDIV